MNLNIYDLLLYRYLFLLLTSIESAKFKKIIYPGDVIRISVFNLKKLGRFFLAECEIKKDNQICSRIKLSCTNKQ